MVLAPHGAILLNRGSCAAVDDPSKSHITLDTYIYVSAYIHYIHIYIYIYTYMCIWYTILT